MSAAEQAAAVRSAAGLFRLEERGLLEVRGSDRVRWLDGMVSNDVSVLEPGPERSGCYAALLTRQGRVVADLHVLLRPDALWLEIAREAAAPVAEYLARYVVADDVAISDRSANFARFGLEGPAAPAILGKALAPRSEAQPSGVRAEAVGEAWRLAPDACLDVRLGGAEGVVAAFGWSGEPAFQILAPVASAGAVAEALGAAGAAFGLVRADREALEILRIEAGTPRLGAELGEDVLPAEARLERAISTTKGCYTGQEVVARLASRGGVKHLLVGLSVAGDTPPDVGSEVCADSQRIGEVTSSCRSPRAGAIALAFVRRPHDAEGTELSVGGQRARVVPLPFVEGLGGQAPEAPGSEPQASGVRGPA